MTNKELADLMFPNIDKDIKYYEELYPKRNLDEKAEVCRFAPSPTGRMHMGNLYASFIPEVFAKQTNGIFILRIEDTDDKRAIENGVELILKDLKGYKYNINENPIEGGEYGPYIQTERKEIYATFAKHLIEIGRAYPCFCTEEDLDLMRKKQEAKKSRIGYYGAWAKCRDLTNEERAERIKNGEKYVIRLKSLGDFNKKIIFKDLVKGTIELPQNDMDQVLIKSDGIPPYAFAHVVDDHLMRVTTVTRDDSYISSVPYHIELWDTFSFEKPKFAHLLPLNKKDGDITRKLSKRKDPEAAVAYHHEKGIPVEAIKLYFATLLNSNFEGWFLEHPTESYRNFNFTFNKMPTSGSLFDMEKLINISKNYLSRISAKEIYENLLEYTNEFDKNFYEILNKYKDYSTAILNIEREQKKPRKDYAMYSDILPSIWYMYDEYFETSEKTYEFQNITDKKEISKILNAYLEVYSEDDDKETWFEKIKELCDKFGYASNMRDYKENPENFKGNVADVSTILRVALTTKHQTPDLYEIMKLIGAERMKQRYESICG